MEKLICPKCRKNNLLPSKYKQGDYYCAGRFQKTCNYTESRSAGLPKIPAAMIIEPLKTPSAEQAAIFQWAANGSENAIIGALAGTGKTTVLVQLVRIFADRNLSVACLAFASRDKAALEQRTAGRAFVKTSNGAGYNILLNYAKSKGAKLGMNNAISWTLVTNKQHDDKKEIKPAVRFAAIQLADKVRSIIPLSAVDPEIPSKPSLSDYQELAGRFGLEIETTDWTEVAALADWLFERLSSLDFAMNAGVDFAGQMFLPVYHGLQPAQKFDRVMIDEGQDQSWINRQIAKAFVNRNGNIIVVGDEYQAIYGWRGADNDAMGEWSSLLETRGSVAEFPLTVCRRCSDPVIEEAQKIVPTIKGIGKPGEVRKLPTDEEFIKELSKRKKGLVLCRANAPGVSLCLKLLSMGCPSVMLKNDIVRSLESFIDKHSDDNDTLVKEVLVRMNNYMMEQADKLQGKHDAPAKLQVISDKIDTFGAFAEQPNVKTAGDVKASIRKIFTELAADGETLGDRCQKSVVISTVHGAKGGEADTVYLWSPASRKGCIWDQVWGGAEDRDNVLYVAITRAERVLVYAGLPPTMSRFSPFEGGTELSDE